MSKSKRKAQTPYGDVDFETNTCASCEQEYLPEDTITAYVGDKKTIYKNRRKVEVRLRPATYRELHFCESCAETPLQLKIDASLKDYRVYLTFDNIYFVSMFVLTVLICTFTLVELL